MAAAMAAREELRWRDFGGLSPCRREHGKLAEPRLQRRCAFDMVSNIVKSPRMSKGNQKLMDPMLEPTSMECLSLVFHVPARKFWLIDPNVPKGQLKKDCYFGTSQGEQITNQSYQFGIQTIGMFYFKLSVISERKESGSMETNQACFLSLRACGWGPPKQVSREDGINPAADDPWVPP